MADSSTSGDLFVYVGTYAPAQSEAIHLYRMSLSSGALERVGGVSGVDNPSFLAIDAERRRLFAVCEVGQVGGRPGGGISAFSLDPQTGTPTLLNQQSSGGGGPCHLTVDKTGRFVLAANYGGGSVCILPVHADGQLGEATDFVQHEGSSVNPQRQREPHAHSINLDPNNSYAFAADLGLDKIMIYRLDSLQGKLIPGDERWASVKAGAGPRHFTFHPGGGYAYVINELDNTVTAFVYEGGTGTLREIQTISTLPDGFTGKSHCAEVLVSPSGRFLYGSNRGHDSIAIFEIDEKTGKLTPRGHEPTQGKNPRNFSIDPTGAFLLAANQDTGNIVTFRIDPQAGTLTPTGQTIEVPKPVCIKMMPASV